MHHRFYSNTQKEAEQQFGELTREQRRNKETKGKIAEIVEEANAKNHEGYDAIRKMVDATASFTLDTYGHVTEKMKKDSANRMQAFIKSVS